MNDGGCIVGVGIIVVLIALGAVIVGTIQDNTEVTDDGYAEVLVLSENPRVQGYLPEVKKNGWVSKTELRKMRELAESYEIDAKHQEFWDKVEQRQAGKVEVDAGTN